MAETSSILQQIYRLGERMRAALDADRTESFVALARERKMLVDRLQKFEHPREVAPNWKTWRDKLAEQHEALTHALAAQEQRMNDTIEHVDQLRTAHDRYHDEMTRRNGSYRSVSV